MSKKVLITGGSGFIGCNMAMYMIKKGYIVRLADCEKPIQKELEEYWSSQDLLDGSKLSHMVAEFDPEFVIHLAAITDLNGKDAQYYKLNVEGTHNLIEACKGLDRLERVIFTSSMLVCKSGYVPVDNEDYNPDTVYGESKVQMEKLIKSECSEISWTIVRPTSIWGPWFKQPYRTFFDMVKNGSYLDMGTHSCTKTYGYIGNVTYQIEKLMTSEASSGKIFYLGDNPPVYISEWAGEITDYLKMKKPTKLPFFMFKIAGWMGDILQMVKISFPVTSFRIRNMTTDNILPLDDLYSITGEPPFTRKQGVGITLDWMNSNIK